ncbi:unnamed protein product [Owenia fusiformis]|uniref:Metalloendopeptidase n=1 Tax=Owenia fusiformis TaxID=6347 RepID=A0A8J1U6H6_OWEFU|nr:unnamed protein product [Owenia fusiformis]
MNRLLIFLAVVSVAFGASVKETEELSPRGPTHGELIVGDILRPDPEKVASGRPDRVWPGGVIPYVIDAAVPADCRAAIDQAIAQYNEKTCIRIVPQTNEIDFVLVMRPQSGCNSYVGNIGGPQVLNLGPGCCSLGTVIHEFMHAIGFEHEHTRDDREDYITVHFNNITPDWQRWYEIIWDTVNFAEYDPASVMHYDAFASRTGTAPTMTTNISNRPDFGNPWGLTTRDIEKIQAMYGCSGRATGVDPCQDGNSQCEGWALSGECESNPRYMRSNCRISCDSCPQL